MVTRFLGLVSLCLCGITALAQNRVQGHLGFVHPLLTVHQNEIRTIANGYVIGFPTGIGLRQSDRFAFDLEVVPFVHGNEGVRNLLIHPGVLWGLSERYTLATRAAFELSGVWGCTPSLTRGMKLGQIPAYADLATPLRWGAGNGLSVTVALHFGIGF